MNILIAFVLFWAVLFAGSLNGAIALGNLDPSIATVVATPSVKEVEPQRAGGGRAAAGDRIVAVDGTPASGRTGRAQDRRAPLRGHAHRRLPRGDAGRI